MSKENKYEKMINDFFKSAIKFLEESKNYKYNKFKTDAIEKNILTLTKMSNNPKVNTAFKNRYSPDNSILTKDGFVRNDDNSLYDSTNFVIMSIDEYYNGNGTEKERQSKVQDFIDNWKLTKAKFKFPATELFGIFRKKKSGEISKAIQEAVKKELVEQKRTLAA
ncbi:MAG TPA: hypothetical protein PKJ33_03150 [Alphaproteobacteria bacterium]|nr:hypothetical protein [Alphaproteobacteria bacterium]